MAYILMLHRLFNRGGKWHTPASLDPSAWKTFSFDINWENLNKMFNLRKFYIEIAPPFSRDAAPRVIELEQLHDDIIYFHVKKSWTHFIFWLIFTVFFVDFDGMDAPVRHFMADDQNAHDFGKLKEGFLK